MGMPPVLFLCRPPLFERLVLKNHNPHLQRANDQIADFFVELAKGLWVLHLMELMVRSQPIPKSAIEHLITDKQKR